MNTTTIVLLGAAYVTCAVLHYGMYVDYFQREWPTLAYQDRYKDRVRAAFMGLAGPMALIISLIMCRPYGWRL